MFRLSGSKKVFDLTAKKSAVVTGIRDRSDAEAMIHRYLELAASLLKDEEVPQHSEEICA